jgi:hypothetical protein
LWAGRLALMPQETLWRIGATLQTTIVEGCEGKAQLF